MGRVATGVLKRKYKRHVLELTTMRLAPKEQWTSR